jgi:predicted acetyltransferase
VARDEDFELGCASEKDYPRIHRLLLAAFHEPSSAEFQSLNDAPRYDPCDRLVIRRGNEIAAHLHLVQRTLRFGGIELPTMDLMHLATLPEYRSRGLARMLFETARVEMRRAGVVCATINARNPRFYLQQGWFPCARFSRSTISALDCLANQAPEAPPTFHFPFRPQPKLAIRVWRRNELDALQQLYDADVQMGFGSISRLESDWRWLVSRNAYDCVYIACESDPRKEAEPPFRTIAGYAVVRDAKIVELVAQNKRRAIQQLLLERICRDALENGRNQVEVHAPPDDPIHESIHDRGGIHFCSEQDGNRVSMACVTQPEKLLNMIKPLLRDRAADGNLSPGRLLNLTAGDESLSITVACRSISVNGYRPTPHVIRTHPGVLGQMILGHRSAAEALGLGYAAASTSEAANMASVLFPAVPLWRPAFEDLPAGGP